MKDFMLTILEDDEYRLHVAVAEAFGSGEDGGAPFPLYRRQPGTTITIVRPSVVPERLMALGQDVRTLAAGEEAGFELAAYAARSGGGKRFAIKTDPERVRWLEERGARLGFDLVGTPDLRTRHVTVRKAREFGFQRTTFTGHLRVTDETLFAGALRDGIGGLRSFGAGLLTVH